MTEFERKCLETIPPDDLRRITDEVATRTKLAYSRLGDLPVEYCTECEKMYRREHLIKTHCLIDVVRMSAVCSWHYAMELEEKLCREYMEAHKPAPPKPKLDVMDFARL